MPSSISADASEDWASATDDRLARISPGLQLPACSKCRLRKVRCDRGSPKCSNCIKSKVACIIVDPETGEQYARDYLRQLEEQEVALSAKLATCALPSSDTPSGAPSASVDLIENPTTAGSTASHSYYVGDGSGLGFLHHILSDPRWQEHRVRIMHQLAARPRIQKPHVQPNPLPPLLEAEALLDNYFTRFHIHHTFLLRHEVLSIFNRLYSPRADETLMTCTAPTLDDVPQNTSSRPTELSIFIHCIKLRQISSRIHTRYYTGTGSGPSINVIGKRGRLSESFSIGQVYTYFTRFQMDLRTWRLTAPIYPDPKSLYERPEWHDFLHEKDLMLLARGALHNIPTRSLIATGVLKEIFTACYGSARRVIELYADLMEKRAITWTRSHFQVIFTAGLTLIYCLNLNVVGIDAVDSGIYQSLNTCQNILNFFKDKMPDAGSFTIAFEILKTECTKPSNIPDEEVRHAGSAMHIEASDRGQGSLTHGALNVDLGALTNPTVINDMLYNSFNDPQLYDFNAGEPDLGPTDNLSLMTQLEAGLGEYAWGWIPLDDDLSNQILLH